MDTRKWVNLVMRLTNGLRDAARRDPKISHNAQQYLLSRRFKRERAKLIAGK